MAKDPKHHPDLLIQQLQKSQRQLSEAQKLAHIGSWEWDIASNTIVWSDELYRVFGVNPETFVANYENFLTCIHPDDRQIIQDAISRAYADHRPFEFHHRILRPDGAEMILYGRGEVIADDAGNPVSMLGTAQDVTALKQAERKIKDAYDDMENQVALRTSELVAVNRQLKNEIAERTRIESALRESNAELTRINEARLIFTSMVSHELRTPLSAIKSGIDLVLDGIDGELNEPQQKILSISKNNVDRLNRLITNILDYTRITTGKMDMQYQAYPISLLLQEVRELMKMEAEKKNISIGLDLPQQAVEAECDADKMKTVIINLVHNAIKFTPTGGSILLRLKSHSGPYLSIEVQDTGIGMTKDVQTNIFHLFAQGPTDKIWNKKGFGVGLAVAKLVTELHQGKIEVESAPGEGSKFTVTFPAFQASAEPPILAEALIHKAC